MRRLALSLALLAAGCVDDQPFRCERDADCARGGDDGVCEPTGFCSFEDTACQASGRRYGDLAGLDLGGQCVPCVAELAAGAHHLCARLQDGTLECWGDGRSGQLGDGGVEERILPVPVEEDEDGVPLPPARSIAAGQDHSCAVVGDGDVLCWGANDHGQLGAAVSGPRARPIHAAQVTPADRVAAGLTHTCVLEEGGAMSCFGDNRASALGVDQDELTMSVEPVTAVAGGIVQPVVAGSAFHSCAVTEQGALLCWGGNNRGQIGDGSLDNATTAASPLAAGTTRSAAAGHYDTCAVRTDGTAACWGANDEGQVGDGTRTMRDRPAPVLDLTGVTQVAVGDGHACARLDDGSAWCWGSNSHGQLGPDAGSSEPEPVRLVATGAVLVVAAAHTTCVLGADGAVSCWGEGSSGERGDGSETDGGVATTVGLSCR